MTIRLYSRLIILGIFCFAGQEAFAQNFLVRHYPENEETLSSTVADMVQDKQGKMWFATHLGVICYDGGSWVEFNQADGLSGKDFTRITADHQNRIWTVCQFPEVQVFYYTQNTWHKIGSPPIRKSRRSNHQDFTVINHHGQIILVLSVLGDGVYIWKAGRWIHYSEKQNLPSNWITALEYWKGELYIASTAGITKLNLDNGIISSFRPAGIPEGAVLGMALENTSQAKPDRFWLCGHNWVGYASSSGFQLLNQDFQFVEPVLVNIAPDGKNGVLFGNLEAVFYLDNERRELRRLNSKNGLTADGATALYVDREWNYWFVSPRGVDKIPSFRFVRFGKDDGLKENEVSAIVESAPGKFWFGHSGGLTFYDGQQFRTFDLPESSHKSRRFNKVIDLKVDQQGNTWAAISGVGVIKIDPSFRFTTYRTFWKPDSGRFVSSIHIDQQGTVWVSGGYGIYQLQNNEIVEILPDSLPQTFVRKIFAGKGKVLYFATSNRGLIRYQENQWTNIQAPDSGMGNNVFAMLEDHHGKTWVGTFGGIYELQANRLIPAFEKYPEANWPIYALLEDNRQRLWVGTDKGVLVIEGQKIRHYGPREGLAGSEVNRSALIQDHQGGIWIGTARGLSYYQKRFDYQDIPPPIVKILGLEVNQERFSFTEPLELSASQNSVRFFFQASSFIDENAVRYRVQLKGFEKSFIPVTPRGFNQVRYTNLPPGRYTFLVQAQNALGAWSKAVASPTLVINLPIYKTWWFWTIGLAWLVMALFAINRYFSKERYLRKLEWQYEQQTEVLRQSEEKFRTLFEETKDIVFIATPDGRFTDINPAGVELLGYASKEEVLALDIATGVFQSPRVYQQFLNQLEMNEVIDNEEICWKRRDGQEIFLLATISIIRDGRRHFTAYRGILHNITETRKLERQLQLAQKMESIGLLAGGIAHDFNNILSSILGYASFIKTGLDETGAIYKYVDIIENSAVRAADLTRQLLGFARGGQHIVEPVDINEILNNILKIIRSTIGKTIEIDMQLSDPLPAVEVDVSQIQQVIINLCVNARDAMKDRGTLTIQTAKVELPKERVPLPEVLHTEYVSISITDTGPGIDDAIREKIFDPFFTTKEKGTGLGLSLVYGVIKKHGGFVEVDSPPGKGARFNIYLPASEHTVPAKSSSTPDQASRSETILVVDDEEIIQEFLKDALQSAGYRVEQAFNGLEAVEYYRKHHASIDLIILDMVMPKMDGKEALRHIRKIDPNQPVIIASGYSANNSEQLQEMGVNGILPKPFRVAELLNQIRTCLDKQNVRKRK